jgi:energy-coupling factor transporter transmembrane protein EcfT
VRATPPVRALVFLLALLDRYWAPIIVVVVVALEIYVFAPRGMFAAMILGGCVGAAVLVAWLGGGAGWRPR